MNGLHTAAQRAETWWLRQEWPHRVGPRAERWWLRIVAGLTVIALVGWLFEPWGNVGPGGTSIALYLGNIVLFVVMVGGALVFILGEREKRLTAFFLVLAFVCFYFSGEYLEQGVVHRRLTAAERAKGVAPYYPCFGEHEAIDRAASVYFTLGTLTTAGTGSLHAQSDICRNLVSLQMVSDLALLGFGIAGVTASVIAAGPSTDTDPRD